MNPKIEKLIKMFARLPRVGNRAATRFRHQPTAPIAAAAAAT